LKDLFDHQPSWSENELFLLKFGRHLRLKGDTKIIIGRTHDDNENILKYHDPETDTIIKVKEYPGPITLIPHSCSKEMLTLAASRFRLKNPKSAKP
jgi:predicted ribosome quality control (RQC) complex YloA/Tae2 family protein